MTSEAPVVGATREPSTVKLALTLAMAGLLSGLALVIAYQGTLPRITANKAARLQKAVFQVLPGATKSERMVWDGSKLEADSGEGKAAGPVIYAGRRDDGSLVGYAIPAEGSGFQDVIRLLYGFNADTRKIIGLQILESRETPGLGDRIYKDMNFVNQFNDLAVDPTVVVVKEPTGKPNEVDAITGATISSKSVVKIINAGNAEWLSRIPKSEGGADGGE